MAVLIPSLAETWQLVEPLTAGERQVAEQLDKLGDDWTTYVQPRLGIDLPDFVAIHRTHGVCAIEVKDWTPGKYRNDDGVVQCLRNGRWDSIQHPLLQPYRYQSTILEHHFAYPEDGAAIVPCVRSILILLNHPTKRARALLRAPAGARWSHVVVHGEEALADIEQALIGRTPCPPPSRSLDRLCQSLRDGRPAFRLRADLILSDNAKDIAKNQRGARTRRVRGAAGSGKSLGLAIRAARLADEGKSVLVTCFNVTLPHYLRSLISGVGTGPSAARVECVHFHGLCGALADAAAARQLRLDVKDCAGAARIVETAIAATAAGVRRRYDAILVDEGQDFRLEWWNLLREHLAPGGEMLLVADDTQRIYDPPRWTDEQMTGAGFSGPWTTLHDSYRIPGDLVPVYRSFAEQHLAGDAWIPSDASRPLRATVRRWINVTEAEVATSIAEATQDVLADDEIVESDRDVTFLCSKHDVGRSVVARLEDAGHAVHHIFAAEPAERQRRKRRFRPDVPGVKGSTVHSFKGWESRVLVVGIGPGEWEKRLAYVAMTRLKQGDARPAAIIVVNANRSLDAFGETFERGVPLPPPALGILPAVAVVGAHG
jgi:hypothetical protein